MRKNKIPSVISILILTLMTIILWVSLSVYHAFTEKPVESVPAEISAPLTPVLDMDTVKQIDAGIYLDSTEIPENVTGKPALPIPTPVPLATSTISPSASPSATPIP